MTNITIYMYIHKYKCEGDRRLWYIFEGYRRSWNVYFVQGSTILKWLFFLLLPHIDAVRTSTNADKEEKSSTTSVCCSAGLVAIVCNCDSDILSPTPIE